MRVAYRARGRAADVAALAVHLMTNTALTWRDLLTSRVGSRFVSA
jgi:hypothetical protein